MTKGLIFLKWSKSEMAKWPAGKKEFDEEITFEPQSFSRNGRLRNLQNVRVVGTADYNHDD